MYALIALGAISFGLCFILTPLFRNLFLALKLVDAPDNVRKLHASPVPRIGGLPIALSYVGALGIVLGFAPKGAGIAIQHSSLLIGLLPAAGIIFATGLIDDLLTLRPWQKLAGQLAAACLAVAAGARIGLLEGHAYGHWISFALSVFWLIGCTNAFNLIDGMDGLASGVGLFATLTMLLAALLQENWGLAMATLPLAGCLLAFLRYNFNPASVFLGDSGSLSVGFLLGCFGVIWSQKSATTLGMLAPVMALALPLLDVSLSIGRRFLRRQPIFKGDRGHIHHRLLALGLHPRDAALVLYAACFIAAILSVCQSSMSSHFGGPIILLFCCLAVFGVRRLGYIEFSTARRVLAGGGVLKLVKEEIHLEHFRRALSSASDEAECWSAIREACKEWEFASVELTLNGYCFQETLNPGSLSSLCMYNISFGPGGHIELSRNLANRSSSVPVSFFEVLRECMEVKDFGLYPNEERPFRSIDASRTAREAAAG